MDLKCTACGKDTETTEHLLICEEYRKRTGMEIKESELKENKIETQRRRMRYMKTVEKGKEREEW